jgi:hypothetical protein
MARQMDMFKPTSTWRRKKGVERKIGYRRLNKWTPANAHKFCMTRLTEIEGLLQEIAGCYSDVDEYIVNTADEIRDGVLPSIRTALDDALAEGRTP